MLQKDGGRGEDGRGKERMERRRGEERQAFYKGQVDLWLTLAVNQSAFL